MPIFVKDAGQWREISSSTGGEVFLRDGTSYTNKTINNIYVNHSGTWREVYSLFESTTFVTVNTAGSSTISVPSNANAIHIKQAVGGGGGGNAGQAYDKIGLEQGGPSGGSGAYISDCVFSVTGGEQLTLNVGAQGAAGTNAYTGGGPAGGGNTTLSGATTGPLFTLIGGGSGQVSGGGVQGPVTTLTGGVAGTVSQIGTRLTSGTTVDGLNITTFTSGEVGSFNQAGSGLVGNNGINYGGDNANGPGANGAASYSNNVPGGTGGNAGNGGAYNPDQVGNTGSQGSGGGGGGTEQGAPGGTGGTGEVVYRYLRMT